jgi:hAT family C-terminal dimerisation region
MSRASDTVLPVRQLFDQVTTMVKLYLSIPVTTATAERTFSVLRRLETYLRTNMSQTRLNNALLLHVHNDYTDKREHD